MPEGDTIFRAARAISSVLEGKTVTRFRSEFPHLNRVDEDEPIAGRRVESVVSRGKHLLMRFSGGLTLRTHMRMNGSWHIYRQGEKWARSSRSMRIVIETEEYVIVGFTIPVAEWIRSDVEHKAAELRRLGPDLLGEQFDREAAVSRMQTHGRELVGDALLDQRVMGGVGNVYKSEVLFLCGVHPERRVSSLDRPTIEALVDRARDLLARNVAAGAPNARITTGSSDPSAALWVYGRGGRPCRQCGTPILRRLMGRDVRSTYWCPICQPSGEPHPPITDSSPPR